MAADYPQACCDRCLNEVKNRYRMVIDYRVMEFDNRTPACTEHFGVL